VSGASNAPLPHERAAPSPSPPAPSHERVAALRALVTEAKQKRLNCGELVCKWLGALVTLPTLGLSGLICVDTNTSLAIFRFGKLDRLITTPGMHWVV